MRRELQGGVVSGAIIVLIGSAFLLDNMGIISIGHLFHFWPLLLIVGGLFAASFVWLAKMSRPTTTERFLATASTFTNRSGPAEVRS